MFSPNNICELAVTNPKVAELLVAFNRIFFSVILSGIVTFILALFVPVETLEMVTPVGKAGLGVIVSPAVAKDNA